MQNKRVQIKETNSQLGLEQTLSQPNLINHSNTHILINDTVLPNSFTQSQKTITDALSPQIQQIGSSHSLQVPASSSQETQMVNLLSKQRKNELQIKDLNFMTNYEAQNTEEEFQENTDNKRTIELLEQWTTDLKTQKALNTDDIQSMKKIQEKQMQQELQTDSPRINMEIVNIVYQPAVVQMERGEQQYRTEYTEERTGDQSNKHNGEASRGQVTFSTQGDRQQIQKSSSFQESRGDDKSILSNNKVRTTSTSKGTSNAALQQQGMVSFGFLQKQLNQKLINDMLLYRIKKKIRAADTSATAAAAAASALEIEQTGSPIIQVPNAVMHSASQNNGQMNLMYRIFSEETNDISNQTVSNFQTINSYFSKPSNIIDYKNVHKTMLECILYPQSIAEGQKFERFKENPKHFKALEKLLLENFMQSNIDFNDKSQRVLQLNQTNLELNARLTMLSQNHIREMNEYDHLELQNINSKDKAKGVASRILQSKAGMEAMLQNNRLKQQREQKEQQYYNQKDIMTNQVQTNNETMSLLEQQLEQLKEKKGRTRLVLKDLYVNMLQTDQNYSKQSLVWIVKSLLRIHEDVKQSFIFPDYLDQESMNFLIQYAQLDIVNDELQDKLRNEKLSSDLLNLTQQGSISQSATNFNDLKTRVSQLVTKSVVRVKKPVFTQISSKNNPEHMLKWENMDSQQLEEQLAFSLSQVPISQIELMKKHRQLRLRIAQIQEFLENLKEVELDRLIKKYIDSVREEEQMKQFKLILKNLYGNNEGLHYFRIFMQQCIDQQHLHQKNQTFTFKSMKSQNNEMESQQIAAENDFEISMQKEAYDQEIKKDEILFLLQKDRQKENFLSRANQPQFGDQIQSQFEETKSKIQNSTTPNIDFNFDFNSLCTEADERQDLKGQTPIYKSMKALQQMVSFQKLEPIQVDQFVPKRDLRPQGYSNDAIHNEQKLLSQTTFGKFNPVL